MKRDKSIRCLILRRCFLGLLVLFSCDEDASTIEKPKTPNFVHVYSQQDYIDYELLKEFEKTSGVKIKVTEYESRDAALARLQESPGVFDLIVANEQTANLFASLKLIEKKTGLQEPSAKDDKNKPSPHTVPYFWGGDGIAVNTAFVKEKVEGWQVFYNEEYNGKLLLIDHPRESVGAVLKYSDLPINTGGTDELMIAELNGNLLRENSVGFGESMDNLNKVIAGEKWVAQVRSGSFAQRAGEAKNVVFVFPKEGYGIFKICLSVGKDCPNPVQARKLIGFMVKPENAARSSARLFYGSLIEGADEYLSEEERGHPISHPPRDVYALGEHYTDLQKVANVHEKIFSLAKKTSDEGERTEEEEQPQGEDTETQENQNDES
ncbi:MAG: extracellular solute-binding protein [Deltaproteobacteria bacterium]|nr:extracellular solute-binding protein [Deltaproteobacteria bacterium]